MNVKSSSQFGGMSKVRVIPKVKIIPRFEALLFIILMFSIIIAIELLVSTPTFALPQTFSDSVSATIPTACSMGLNNNEHASTPTAGTYSQIGGEGEDTIITITCNGKAGYELYAVGAGNEGDEGERRGDDKTSLVSTTNPSNKIITSTATSGETSAWHFKLSHNEGSLVIAPGFDEISVIPGGDGNGTRITSRNPRSSNNTGDKVHVSYHTYITTTQAPGVYTGKVKYTLTQVAAPVDYTYTINYDPSASAIADASPSGMPTTQTGSARPEDSYEVTIDNATPTASSYEFKGWCDNSSIINNGTSSEPTCTGTTYQPGGRLTIGSDNFSLTLFAMWKQQARSYTIEYKSNIGSPSGMPSPNPQTGSVTSPYAVKISSITPKLSNYTFQGWCNSATSNESCSGTTYKTGASWAVPNNGAKLTLYAMWKKDSSCSGTIHASPNATFGGKKWTTTYVTCNWEDANNACPSGYHLPSQSEFQSLLDSEGSNSQLYNAGWSGYYWSSTEQSYYTYCAYYLYVISSIARIQFNDNFQKTNKFNVRCVSD